MDFQTYWDRQINRLKNEDVETWFMNKLYIECQKTWNEALTNTVSMNPATTIGSQNFACHADCLLAGAVALMFA